MSNSPILFYSPGSCSFGAMVTLEWLGKPFRLCRVDRDARATPAFKSINPEGQVPAYKDGEKILVENIAILQHLAAKDLSKNLTFKQGTAEFDKMSMVLAYFATNFHGAFKSYFAPMRLHDDAAVQEQIKQKSMETIRSKYEYLNKLMSGNHNFIFGDKPTIADAYFYGMARWGKFLDIKKDYPNIAKFQEAMERDPAVQFALAVEKDENIKPTAAFEGHVKLSDIAGAAKAA